MTRPTNTLDESDSVARRPDGCGPSSDPPTTIFDFGSLQVKQLLRKTLGGQKPARKTSGFTAGQAPVAGQDTTGDRKVLIFGPLIVAPGIISLDAFARI
jgi:hypothetical protein